MALKIREALIPVGSPVGRGGERLQPQGLVLHATATYEARAQAIRDYWARLQSPKRVNAHIVVDWDEALVVVPWEPGKCEKAWHVGEPGNSRFIGIELCQSKDKGKAEAAYRNWVAMAARVLHAYGWPADRDHLWTHRRVSLELGGTTHTDPDGYLAELGRRPEDAMVDIAAELLRLRQEEDVPIVGPASATVEQAKAWAKARGATDTFVGLADLYWRLAPLRGGVDPAVAYAQAAKETAFGRFGGAVTPDQHNPCGLKVTNPRGDRREDHATFSSWEEGVTAHLDHLALYAGAPGYPRPGTPDPRHFPSIRGTAATVAALGGRWAPSPDYGRSIIRDYYRSLVATVVDVDWRSRYLQLRQAIEDILAQY